jgi:hypothetical protein
MRRGLHIRSSAAWTGLFVALCLATPALADAPVSPESERQYETFDTYSQEIRDRFTKLKWKRSIFSKLTQAAAATQCANIPPNGTWRLPTVKELLTIVDEDPQLEYDQQQLKSVNKYIDDSAFRETPTDAPYWTATVDPTDGSRVLTVSFANGTVNGDLAADQRYYRCVTNDGP